MSNSSHSVKDLASYPEMFRKTTTSKAMFPPCSPSCQHPDKCCTGWQVPGLYNLWIQVSSTAGQAGLLLDAWNKQGRWRFFHWRQRDSKELTSTHGMQFNSLSTHLSKCCCHKKPQLSLCGCPQVLMAALTDRGPQSN